MAIRDKVAIIGVGCTKFGEHWEQSAEDMMVEAAYEALDDAGIGPEEIQAAWLGTTTSGRGGPMLAHALKLEYIPVTRVENHCATGTDALRNACYSVAAGACKVALVMGVEKLKDQGFAGLQGHPEIASSEVRVPVGGAQYGRNRFARETGILEEIRAAEAEIDRGAFLTAAEL